MCSLIVSKITWFPLTKLPIEVLDQIVRWLHFDHLIRLCMTNDRALLYLLQLRGGCQTISMHVSTTEGPYVLENSLSKFRTLRELNVKSLDIGLPGNDIGAFLASLPPTLTKLVVGPINLTQNGDHSAVNLSVSLPRLQSLHIATQTLEKLDTMRTLPLGLENLILEGRVNPDDVAFLPRGLQTLSLVVSGYDNDKFIRVCCERCLPPNLQCLKLFAVMSASEEMIEALPRTIESLWMDGEQSLPPSHVSLLPPTLTQYSLVSNSRLTDEALANLPRTITSLSIQLSPNISAQGLKGLPCGLKSIALRRLVQTPANGNLSSSLTLSNPFSTPTLNVDTCIANLPKTLTSFEMLNGGAINNETLVKKLIPPHLIHLRTSPDTADQIESEAIAHFPRDMQSLIIAGSLLTDAAAPLLPPRLTTLNLGLASNITDAFCESLPCTLLRLYLPSAQNLSDTAIEKLPRGLSFLQLLGAVRLTSKAIPYLPRSLQVLDLSENTNFNDDSIRHLPRTLTFLSLRQARALTEACLPSLPKGLRLLVLPHDLTTKYREPQEEQAKLRKTKAVAYAQRQAQQRPRSGSL